MTHTPSQMPELKPCPFCNAYSVHPKREGYEFFIECDDCGAKGPHIDPENHPIDRQHHNAWNTRAASVPSEDERLKELSAQLIERGYVDAKFYDGVTKRDAIEMMEAILSGKTKPFTPFNDSTHSVTSDLSIIADQMQNWLDWDKDGSKEDDSFVIPPTWPTRKVLNNWIAALRGFSHQPPCEGTIHSVGVDATINKAMADSEAVLSDKERILGEDDVVAVIEIDGDGENTPAEALHHELMNLYNKGIIKSFLTGDDALASLTTTDQSEVIDKLVEDEIHDAGSLKYWLDQGANILRDIAIKGKKEGDRQILMSLSQAYREGHKTLALAEKARGA